MGSQRQEVGNAPRNEFGGGLRRVRLHAEAWQRLESFLTPMRPSSFIRPYPTLVRVCVTVVDTISSLLVAKHYLPNGRTSIFVQVAVDPQRHLAPATQKGQERAADRPI